MSTRRTSKFPVPCKASLVISPTSCVTFPVEVFMRITTSSGEPNSVIDADAKISFVFNFSRISFIGACVSYFTCTIVPPAKSTP